MPELALPRFSETFLFGYSGPEHGRMIRPPLWGNVALFACFI